MTFLLDQDVPDTIARVIQATGHEVQHLRHLMPVNSTDEAVMAFADARGAILVTCNRDDFLALAKSKPHSGIIILVRRPSRVAECSCFLRLLESAGKNGLRNNINFA